MNTDPPHVCVLYYECDKTTPKIADSLEEFVASLHYRR